MSILKLCAETDLINDNILKAMELLKFKKSNLEIDTNSVTKANEAVKKAKSTQQSNSVAYENNEKKFKAIVKYGDILRKIETLLGLMPSNLDNLSVEELNEKLDELKKSRTRSSQQLSFIFYQNLLTDLLTNLMNIEKDFQAGSLSSKDALLRVKDAKFDIKMYANEMPPVMQQPLQQASHLVKMYEAGFSQVIEQKNNNTLTPLIQTEVPLEHQVLFDELNNNTTQLLNRVGSLNEDLSNFEPQVQLNKLMDNLNDTESILSFENWNLEDFESSMANLDLTTNLLIDEQNEKNKTNEKLTEEIASLTKETNELSKTSSFAVSEETFKSVSSRAETSIQNLEIVGNFKAEDGISADFQTQFAETVLSQIEADQHVSDAVAVDPESATMFKDDSLSNQAEDAAENLKDQVLAHELENGHIKHLNLDIDTDDEDEKRKKLELLKKLKEEEEQNGSES